MSVTNAAELIATELVRRYGLNPSRMLFIEHYPEAVRPMPYGESYALVTFAWGGFCARSPAWRHMPPAEFNEILHSINE